MLVNHYEEAKNEFTNLLNICQSLIEQLLLCGNEFNRKIVSDYMMMNVIAERMFSVHYKQSVVETLVEFFNKNKSTEDDFKFHLFLTLGYYYKDFIEELDNNIHNSDTFKYHDYRCIDFVHRWGNLCRYYKTYYNEQFNKVTYS